VGNPNYWENIRHRCKKPPELGGHDLARDIGLGERGRGWGGRERGKSSLHWGEESRFLCGSVGSEGSLRVKSPCKLAGAAGGKWKEISYTAWLPEKLGGHNGGLAKTKLVQVKQHWEGDGLTGKVRYTVPGTSSQKNRRKPRPLPEATSNQKERCRVARE